MYLSTAALMSGMIFSFCMLLIIYIILVKSKSILDLKYIKLILLCGVLATVRFLIPIELNDSLTVEDWVILPAINQLLVRKVLGKELWIIVAMIMLSGTLILSLKKCFEYIQIKKILSRASLSTDLDIHNHLKKIEMRLGRTLNLKVVQFEDIQEPFIFGFIDVYVVMPIKLSEEIKAEYILEHEVEHYIHGDLWLKLLFEILSSIYWWNPVIYLIRKQIFDVLEFYSDISVLESLSDRERTEYAECLFYMAKTKRKKNEIALSLSFTDSSPFLLKRRIVSIINYGVKHRYRKKFLHILVVFFMFIISLITVVEPCQIEEEVAKESFSVTEDDIYIIRNNNSYDIYCNGKLVGNVKQIPEELANIQVKGE